MVLHFVEGALLGCDRLLAYKKMMRAERDSLTHTVFLSSPFAGMESASLCLYRVGLNGVLLVVSHNGVKI